MAASYYPLPNATFFVHVNGGHRSHDGRLFAPNLRDTHVRALNDMAAARREGNKREARELARIVAMRRHDAQARLP